MYGLGIWNEILGRVQYISNTQESNEYRLRYNTRVRCIQRAENRDLYMYRDVDAVQREYNHIT